MQREIEDTINELFKLIISSKALPDLSVKSGLSKFLEDGIDKSLTSLDKIEGEAILSRCKHNTSLLYLELVVHRLLAKIVAIRKEMKQFIATSDTPSTETASRFKEINRNNHHDITLTVVQLRTVYTALELLWILGLREYLKYLNTSQSLRLDEMIAIRNTPNSLLVNLFLFEELQMKVSDDFGRSGYSILNESRFYIYLETLQEIVFDDLFSDLMLPRNMDRLILSYFVLRHRLKDKPISLHDNYRNHSSSSSALISTESIDRLLSDLLNRPYKALIVNRLRNFNKAGEVVRAEALSLLTQIMISENGVLAVLSGYLDGVIDTPHCESMQAYVSKLIVSVPSQYDKNFYFHTISKQIVQLIFHSLATQDKVLMKTLTLIVHRMMQFYPSITEEYVLKKLFQPLFRFNTYMIELSRSSNTDNSLEKDSNSPLEEKPLIVPATNLEVNSNKSKKVLIEEITPDNKGTDRQTSSPSFASNDALLSKDDLILMVEILNYLLFTSPLFSNLVISFNRLSIPAALLSLYKELLLALQTALKKNSNQPIAFDEFEKYPLMKQLREILLKFLLNQSSLNIPPNSPNNGEEEASISQIANNATIFQYSNSIQIIESFILQRKTGSNFLPSIRLVVTEDSFFEIYSLDEKQKKKLLSDDLWNKTLSDLHSNPDLVLDSDDLLENIFQTNDAASDSITPSFESELIRLQRKSSGSDSKQSLLQNYKSDLKDLTFHLRIATHILSCFDEKFWNGTIFLRKSPDLTLANNFISSLFAYILANYLYSDKSQNPFRKADKDQNNSEIGSSINSKTVNKVKFGVILIGLQRYIPLESLLSNELTLLKVLELIINSYGQDLTHRTLTPAVQTVASSPLISEMSSNNNQTIDKEEEERKIEEEDTASVFDFALPILNVILGTLNKDLYANSRVMKSCLTSIRIKLQEIVLLDRRDNSDLFREEVMVVIDRMVALQSNSSNPISVEKTQILDESHKTFEEIFQEYQKDILDPSPVNKAYAMRQLISCMSKRQYTEWERHEKSIFELIAPSLLERDSYVYLNAISFIVQWNKVSPSLQLWNTLIQLYGGHHYHSHLSSLLVDRSPHTHSSFICSSDRFPDGEYSNLIDDYLASLVARIDIMTSSEGEIGQQIDSFLRFRCMLGEVITQILAKHGYNMTLTNKLRIQHDHSMKILFLMAMKIASEKFIAFLPEEESSSTSRKSDNANGEATQSLSLFQRLEEVNIFTGRRSKVSKTSNSSSTTTPSGLKQDDLALLDRLYFKQSTYSILSEIVLIFSTTSGLSDHLVFLSSNYDVLRDLFLVCRDVFIFDNYQNRIFVAIKRSAISLIRFIIEQFHEVLFRSPSDPKASFQLLTDMLRVTKAVLAFPLLHHNDAVILHQAEVILADLKELTVFYFQLAPPELSEGDQYEDLAFLKIVK